MPSSETGTKATKSVPHDSQEIPCLPGQETLATAVDWVVPCTIKIQLHVNSDHRERTQQKGEEGGKDGGREKMGGREK